MHLIILTLSPKQNFSVYLECNYQTESLLNPKPMFPSSKHFTSLFLFSFSSCVIPYGSPWKIIMPCIMQDTPFEVTIYFGNAPLQRYYHTGFLVDDLLFMGHS
jgi:hypothetical protein